MPSDHDNGSSNEGGPWGKSGGGKEPPQDKSKDSAPKDTGNIYTNSPWGKPSGHNNRGGGNAGGPPDMDEWLKRGQDRFKQAVPGGMSNTKTAVLIAVASVAIWLASGFYRVEPDQQAVVLRFGKLVRTEESGLRYHWPSPIEQVLVPRVTRENLIQVGFRGDQSPTISSRRSNGADPRDVPEESIMLTGDENIINIDFVVKWRIDNAANFLFKIREPEQTIKRAAESAMREVIARTNIQPALTEARERIQEQTRQILQTMLNEYEAGVLITGVELLNVQVPSQVVDAFDDVQRAAQDRQRLRNEAETYRNRIIPEARGMAERMSQEAQAYRSEVVNRAKGDADRFSQIYDSYRNAKDVTTQRIYLETLEDVLKNANKVIVEDKGGVVPYLPLDRLNAAGVPSIKRGEP